MRPPRDFLTPLATGAPDPATPHPAQPTRTLHFLHPGNTRMVAKLPTLLPRLDVLVANLEDGVPTHEKAAARHGVATLPDLGDTLLWVRTNGLATPWALDDLLTLTADAGTRIDTLMIPKVEGPEDIHYLDRLLAQLEARHHLTRPLRLHPILETARGVTTVEAIATASPRIQGISLGPADLAADRRMKTTRVGGGHPGYLVRADPGPTPTTPRPTHQQDLWHYTLARLVDACAAADVLPYYGPFGDIADTTACEDQYRNAYLLGCVGTWTLHPTQVDIARRVFSPDPTDVTWARRVLAALPDGTGAVMVDGTMQDDASVKQCRVVLDLAHRLASRDPDLARAYGLDRPTTTEPTAGTP